MNLFMVFTADNCIQVNLCILTVALSTAPRRSLGLQERDLDGRTLVPGSIPP